MSLALNNWALNTFLINHSYTEPHKYFLVSNIFFFFRHECNLLFIYLFILMHIWMLSECHYNMKSWQWSYLLHHHSRRLTKGDYSHCLWPFYQNYHSIVLSHWLWRVSGQISPSLSCSCHHKISPAEKLHWILVKGKITNLWDMAAIFQRETTLTDRKLLRVLVFKCFKKGVYTLRKDFAPRWFFFLLLLFYLVLREPHWERVSDPLDKLVHVRTFFISLKILFSVHSPY